MFTGIIQDIGTITHIDKDGDWFFKIQTALDLTHTAIGASIACSGCCLTVVQKGEDWFGVEVSMESLSKTSLGKAVVGQKINLEPSLKLGDELGGHLVSGHVDGLCELIEIKANEGSHCLTLRVPDAFAVYVAQKGSIALDGVSLTVNDVQGACFDVNIIPHTWEVTTLGQLALGAEVHFEVDMLARYIQRRLEINHE